MKISAQHPNPKFQNPNPKNQLVSLSDSERPNFYYPTSPLSLTKIIF